MTNRDRMAAVDKPSFTSGVCTVTFTLKDSWGQIGTPSFSLDVNNPKPLAVSSGGAISSTPVPSGGQR
ncbi:MAG TPA: hypothetical protein VK595_00845 [Vicinamibacterales bacterium]|nr:hypothetical protein [Vicinamibacterales bacterium]